MNDAQSDLRTKIAPSFAPTTRRNAPRCDGCVHFGCDAFVGLVGFMILVGRIRLLGGSRNFGLAVCIPRLRSVGLALK